MLRYFLVLFLLCSLSSYCQTTLYGKAIRIMDGDTFELLVDGGTTYRIRLTDIDCPEKGQDFGNVAKQRLAYYIFGKEVRVVYYKLDRNKRILGHVYTGTQNINLKMVEDGLAWHFKKYSADQLFAAAEIRARKEKTGIWSHKDPIAPWDFRKKKKTAD